MTAFALPELSPPDSSWNVVSGARPPHGKLVLYRTAHYQMLGYINANGRWIGSDGKEEDLPVQWWREIGPDVALLSGEWSQKSN